MTFIVDTGAVECLYFSEKAMDVMEENKLVQRGSNFSEEVVFIRYGSLNGYKMKVGTHKTPKAYEPANIIGLKLLLKLGFRCKGQGWNFEEPVSFF
jgi:hypothetical protein